MNSFYRPAKFRIPQCASAAEVASTDNGHVPGLLSTSGYEPTQTLPVTGGPGIAEALPHMPTAIPVPQLCPFDRFVDSIIQKTDALLKTLPAPQPVVQAMDIRVKDEVTA